MIKKIKYRISVYKELAKYSEGLKLPFIINILMSIVVLILNFIEPTYYRMFIDEVILNSAIYKIYTVCFGYSIIFMIRVAIKYIKQYINYTLENTLLYRIKLKILNQSLSLRMKNYENINVGDLKMRFENDVDQIKDYVERQAISYSISCITAVISLILMLVIEWRLAIFSLIVIPTTIVVDNILSKNEKDLQDTNRENDQKLYNWLGESISGWREVKALNLYISQERRYVKFLNVYAEFFSKWINYWTARVLVIPKIKDEFLMQFGLYFLGGIFIINDYLKIGDLILFITYYNMLTNSIKEVSLIDSDLQSNMPFTNRLLDVLNMRTNTDYVHITNAHKSTIALVDVTFRYNNESRIVIKDFNCRIEQGDKVAIIGKSGCGKTTLLKLITGLLEPTSGKVYYGDTEVHKICISELYEKIGFVMQDNVLFNTTLRDNFWYGKNGAADEEIFAACKKACIYDFIISLPEGLDTVIGEGGIKLSGGQRQRIVLARLFLKDNIDVYIFDEATSALDEYNENLIHDVMKTIAVDKTIIIVSHRQSSISICDKIIDLDEIDVEG